MTKLQIRIDDETKSQWLLKAKIQGTTLTDLIVQAVNGVPVRKKKRVDVDPALIRQLASIGNNLNQIAKWANRHKQSADAIKVIIELIEIDRELSEIRQALENNNAD